jgi:DNA-binding HxlR family transcriptional regulator
MSTRKLLPSSTAESIEEAMRCLEGRWKLLILFRLIGGRPMRFSGLEKAIPAISQKMLIQQLRQLETDGIVARTVHQQVPPRVDYVLTDWGLGLCPALDAIRRWAALRPPASGKPNASKQRG